MREGEERGKREKKNRSWKRMCVLLISHMWGDKNENHRKFIKKQKELGRVRM